MINHSETILTGKKVVLFPLASIDLDHFIQLHRADINGYMQRYSLHKMTDDEAKRYITLLLDNQQMFVFTVLTKEGKSSRRAGYVYMTDLTESACEISGIMDKEFARGLGRQLRKDKYTYAQDAMHTLIEFLTNKLKLQRIQISLLENNAVARAMALREHFEVEGVLRKLIKINGEYKNVVIMSIINTLPDKQDNQEVQHGEKQPTATSKHS